MMHRLALQCSDEVLMSRRCLEFGGILALPTSHEDRDHKDEEDDKNDEKAHIPSFQASV